MPVIAMSPCPDDPLHALLRVIQAFLVDVHQHEFTLIKSRKRHQISHQIPGKFQRTGPDKSKLFNAAVPLFRNLQAF